MHVNSQLHMGGCTVEPLTFLVTRSFFWSFWKSTDKLYNLQMVLVLCNLKFVNQKLIKVTSAQNKPLDTLGV